MSPKKSSVEERRRIMDLTRRELERLVLAGLSAPLFPRPSTAAPAKPNSKVKGVQIGVQSYSFRDRGLDEAIQAMLDVGLSSCELYSGHVEPRESGPRGPQAREELRKWRVETPLDHFEGVGAEFDTAGIAMYDY